MCADNVWEIVEAHDINNNTWIVALGDRSVIGGLDRHALLLTPELFPLDVTDDGYIDESDLAAIFLITLVTNGCPQARICVWDVNFDCVLDQDDYDAVADYIANCETEPCPCEGGDSFTQGEGLSIERYTLALAALEPEMTSEQMALAWEWFFDAYYRYQ